MKRLLFVLITCLLSVTFAWASPQQPKLTLVRATHVRGVRHHAHKAHHHRAPRHHHRMV